MSKLTALKALLALASALLMALAMAPAARAGTPAWTITELPVFSGPGTRYDLINTVPGGLHLSVVRCRPQWCEIASATAKGWVSRDRLSFGQYPRGPLSGPKLFIGRGGPGAVCLYSGTDYSGTELCQGPGYVVDDLALLGLDNQFSSVRIEGDVSVKVCRDFYFSNYCEIITHDTPDLGLFLKRAVSSIRVY